ncbi:MAG: TIGR03618 family F420-dependent PPOX class oxidoreductase [Chloroflexi bacterium]|nr:TIGR03618 family F420-dependent PPOX class oxidoreductase [Chloroflexota bacterium]MDA1239794.1 TIGR03618 family F420-dependent PPOX class oxidoreductase [Chloroflexota bacterium]
MSVFTPEQETYVRERQLCVLGTGKRDGSPQLSMVTYMFDGTYLLSSITKDRAKYANIRRQPHVAVLIPDGRRQLIVYGTAEILEGKERDAAIIAIRAHQGDPLPADYDLDRFPQRLDELKRVVVRVAPERAFSND